MLDLIFEGLFSLRFGCTIGFVLPRVGPALALGRRAWLAPIALIGAAGTVGWARFSNRWFDTPSTWILTVLAVAIVVATVASFRGSAVTDKRPGPVDRFGSFGWATSALVLAALVAGWLWVPCVGEHFSEPLNNATTDPAGTWMQVLAYVAGIGAPLIVLAALPVAFPRLAKLRDSAPVRVLGVGLAAVVSLSIAVGWYSDLVIRFAPA